MTLQKRKHLIMSPQKIEQRVTPLSVMIYHRSKGRRSRDPVMHKVVHLLAIYSVPLINSMTQLLMSNFALIPQYTRPHPPSP